MRNSIEFEQYVYEKSRKQAARIKVRKRLIASAAVICLIAVGGIGAAKTLDNPSVSDLTTGNNNAPMYGVTHDNTEDYSSPAGATQSEALVESGYYDSFYNNYNDDFYSEDATAEDDEVTHNHSEGYEKSTAEDDAAVYNEGYVTSSADVYFYDAIKILSKEYILPDYVEIYEGDKLLTSTTDEEIIQTLCDSTLSQFTDSQSEPITATEKYTVIFGYESDKNAENVIASIDGQKVEIDDEYDFVLTEEYLNIICGTTANYPDVVCGIADNSN